MAALILGAAPPGLAQVQTSHNTDTDTTSNDADLFTGTSLTTTTTGVATTLVGGGIALTIILVNQNDSSSSKEEYIRQNAVALKQDLTLGSGETVRDLAAAFQVEHRDRETFARMLRKQRDDLLPLTNLEKLNERRAERFFQTIARGMHARKHLRDDLREISFVMTSEG